MFDARPLVLSPLPYPYEGLAPALSADQVQTHYERHHSAYVQAANEILGRVGGSVEGFARAPSSLWDKYLFNVNGARLHSLFWETFIPGGRDPSPWLNEQIGHDLYSLRRDVVRACGDVQGSGWTFLSMRKQDGDLLVHNVPNHAFPWEELDPLIVLDSWEHSYYLDYRNERKRYAEALLTLVNWLAVEHRLLGRKGPVPR
jgi:Fe-Mn family superoxide dismutase